jgi:methionine synthase I (cobalamin-dependent)/5,10-methylenetetrahydrofolate reductase
LVPGHALLERLRAGETMLADGAMGTLLHSRGIRLSACLDALNLEQPELVLDVHRAYVKAGCDILETNTFGANRFKLAAYDIESQVDSLNASAARLARQAAGEAGRPVWIAGSIGPLGARLAPYGRLLPERAGAAFREQAEALLQAGVDLIWLETFSDLRELRIAVEAARQAGDLPILASMTFTRDDRTLMGDSPQAVAEGAQQAGADIVGANCSEGPSQLLRVIQQMHQAAPMALLSAMPNAGWPERSGGRMLYPASPDYFAEYALALRLAGASILGGCCGTTPAHCAAMRHALHQETPAQAALLDAPGPPSVDAAPFEGPTRLQSRLRDDRFTISVELDPPRGFSTQKTLAAATLLAESGADVLTVADSPMARLRMSPWAICHLVQRETGRECVLHFPTRGRNLLRIQGDLLAAHALGIRNLLVVMGDPTTLGDSTGTSDRQDVVPSGLVRLIHQSLNLGLDDTGSALGEATAFFVGCALNLAPSDPDREMRALHKKVEAGAGFVMTQPVYDAERAAAFLQAYASRFGPLTIPILGGILPLVSSRHAAFLQHEVPGVEIPSGVARRMAESSHPADEGVRMALEVVEALAPNLAGLYIMPALERYDVAAGLVEAVRTRHP